MPGLSSAAAVFFNYVFFCLLNFERLLASVAAERRRTDLAGELADGCRAPAIMFLLYRFPVMANRDWSGRREGGCDSKRFLPLSETLEAK